MIEGLNLEVWGQRARRVKAVLVTEENRNAILLWLGFTQDEIDNALGGIAADLDVGDALVLTAAGNTEVEDDVVDVRTAADGTRLAPKPGQFTRVHADQVDYLYRRNTTGLDQSTWYGILDLIEQNDPEHAVE